MADGVSRMFIGALRRSLEQGRQDARLRLARSDETVEVFRHNKVQLRMQLLTGTMQDRRAILRAAIVVRRHSQIWRALHGACPDLPTLQQPAQHRYPNAWCYACARA